MKLEYEHMHDIAKIVAESQMSTSERYSKATSGYFKQHNTYAQSSICLCGFAILASWRVQRALYSEQCCQQAPPLLALYHEYCESEISGKVKPLLSSSSITKESIVTKSSD